jgi:hypothetical protein
MKLEEIATAYVAMAELENKIQTQAPALADEAGCLRADLHAIWMAALREHGIPYADRVDAAQLAQKFAQSMVSQP